MLLRSVRLWASMLRIPCQACGSVTQPARHSPVFLRRKCPSSIAQNSCRFTSSCQACFSNRNAVSALGREAGKSARRAPVLTFARSQLPLNALRRQPPHAGRCCCRHRRPCAGAHWALLHVSCCTSRAATSELLPYQPQRNMTSVHSAVCRNHCMYALLPSLILLSAPGLQAPAQHLHLVLSARKHKTV